MNAKVPLKILTPEGSGQALHPDVLYKLPALHLAKSELV
jgi:hypothetical protein